MESTLRAFSSMILAATDYSQENANNTEGSHGIIYVNDDN